MVPEVLVVDIDRMEKEHRQQLVDRTLRTKDMDNQRFLVKVRERLDRCDFIQAPGAWQQGTHVPVPICVQFISLPS